MHSDFCIVSDFPSTVGRDEQNRPHCLTGPQQSWRDGWALYFIHGVRVSRRLVMNPETITATEIRDEQNAEVRRIMLARFEGVHGKGSYIQAVGAKLVHKDEYGELYRIEMGDDEPLQMVKVMNSTPEPDGSIKPYWLRVSPDVRTAHGAVASTFRNPKTNERLTARDYNPLVQT